MEKGVKGYWKYLVAILTVLLLADVASAQRRGLFGRRNRVEIQPIDTAALQLPDSVIAYRDSVHRADSIARRDSLELLSKSSLERPAFSTAKDSVVEVFSDGQRKIYYYGDVSVSYQNMKLTADYMEYDLNTGIVYAKGTLDPVTQEVKGRPEMTQDGKTYKMEELRYNFNNQKAVIKNMITKEDDGILQGRDINMSADRSISIMRGMYTVCDLEHPHYYLNLYNARVITRPTQKTVFGPAWPTFEDVPFPFGIPFGFIPKKPERSTGFLMPTFGEENARGFYFRDMGMYFVIGDYFDLSVTGDVYTLGSWSMEVNSRYKVNYKFNGTFGFTYSNDQTGEWGSRDFYQSKNFGLKWSHSQDSKAHPGTSFTASVNFSSPSNSKYNSRSVTEALQNQISSSISYSKNWNGKVNLSVNALHNQNSRDSSYTFTLPNISLSVTRFYPFKRQNRVGKERFYEKISFGYSTSFQNRVNFKMSELQEYSYNPDGSVVIDPANGLPVKEFKDVPSKLLDKMNNGMNHNFQIGLPNFTLLNYLNFTPSISYGMNWLFSSGRRYLEGEVDEAGHPVMVPSNDEGGGMVQAMRMVEEKGGAFNTFGVTQTYSGSISMSTRIYGMYNFGKHKRLQALRHVISPSISANFRPEQGTYFNGWRTLDAYYDKDGKFHDSSDYNIYSLTTHNSGSAPGKGKTAGLSFSLGNNFEAKMRDIRDTTGTGSKKVKIIDQLNLNGSYNFLADSLKMSNIGVSMSTSIFGKLGLSANANFDPYAVDGRGKKINTFNFVKEGWAHPLRLTNASASLSYSLNGKGSIDGNDGGRSGEGGAGGGGKGGGGGAVGGADSYKRIYYHPITGEYIPGGYLYYMNPNVPWSINLSYSFNYSTSYQFSQATNQLVKNNKFTQTLQMSGNLKLTPRMDIQMTSGFDVMAMKMTTTQISARYDLHCFNIAVSWVPTGNWQSYSFLIAANAAALADLLRFKKSSSYMDNMLGY